MGQLCIPRLGTLALPRSGRSMIELDSTAAEPVLTAATAHAKFSRSFTRNHFHGKSIGAFQILEQVEKVEKVNEEVSKKINEQVEQVDKTGERASSPIP